MKLEAMWVVERTSKRKARIRSEYFKVNTDSGPTGVLD